MLRYKIQETRNKKAGLTLVEVVIASAIILAAVMTLLGVHSLYLKASLSGVNSVKATYLAEEAIEVLRFMRSSSWSVNISPLTLNINYGLVLNSGAWQATTSNTFVENFERTVTLSAVYRDANSDIVSSGGTLDPDTKLIQSKVSWPSGGTTTTRTISTYLTNLYQN